MTLYFENPLNFPETGSISLDCIWHPSAPLLAVSSFSQERGGFVTVFDELGEPVNDLNPPVHRSYQATALAWHPERKILATGWENGDFKVWNGTEKDFNNIGGPHKAPITLLQFSEKGARLASADSGGSLVGWKVDSKGLTVIVFHLDLKEAITHLTFRLTIRTHSDYDVENLAKAAVNGDEQALDLFSNNWRPKTTARKFKVQDGFDNLSFYVATQAGSIYHVNNGGTCMEVLNTEGTPLTHVLHHPSKDSLIVMMEGLTIGHFAIDSQGHLSEMAKVKLSGRSQSRPNKQSLIWAGGSTFAILTGDLVVRIWNIETNDNYVLPTIFKTFSAKSKVDSDSKRQSVNETFTCLSFCKSTKALSAGSNLGRIYFWGYNLDSVIGNSNEENCAWDLINVNSIHGTVKQLNWSSDQLRLPLLAVNCVTNVYLMKEQNICSHYHPKIWAVQRTSNQISLESDSCNRLVQIEHQVTDLAINETHALFSNGRQISIYDLIWSELSFDIKLVRTLNCDNEKILIYKKSLVVLTPKSVLLKNFTGTTVGSLTFTPVEGEPIGIDVTGNYLTIFTIEGYFKIYNLNEDRYLLVTKFFGDLCPDFGEIIQAKTNSGGARVALTVAAANLIPDGKLYIYDIESDQLVSHDFRNDYVNDKGSGGEGQPPGAGLAEACANRIPLYVYWDDLDARLLTCDARKIKQNQERVFHLFSTTQLNATIKHLNDEDHVVVTMFVTAEIELKFQDVKGIDPEGKLLGISPPFIAVLEKLTVNRYVMADFHDLKNCDASTKAAVLDFSYNLSLGNMDAAFKAIKTVQSPNVWGSLARMCVKTRRLDVASVCLGHMGNARAAMALRLAMDDPNDLPVECKLAVLAVHLGMLSEAEELYTQCGRYDLLNKLLRSQNKMSKAHKVAETKDRIHLRNTEYVWAKELELKGDFKEAASRYEKANTHKFDIPRMLMERPQQLHSYMSKTKDPDLLKWWGQYVESQGDMQEALGIYSRTGDIYSQVRVLCFLEQESKAVELTRAGQDKAAFYHMARFFENKGNYEDAVMFFNKANAYSNAVRLCKENRMSEELWNIGTAAPGNREKLECARYFEEIGSTERAVILYHRSGMLHKALDLAFKTQQFDALQQIASDLDATSDPALIEKCAEYFVNNEQFDKAVDLLAIAKKFKEAISICLNYNVQLTEDLAEKLTPEKDQLDEAIRVEVLENLAESLMVQGNYHLATKKFTQAGNKLRAMKALLKSGDTDKIIFFAGVSRQREIYIMAANYLQTLDWQDKPEILRNIINFYSKGKALDLLANFYVACAQVEIDEFKNYEKALGALTEASRCLTKITNVEKAKELIQQRISATRKFVDIRRVIERGDHVAGLAQCKQLLMYGGHDLESSVHRGDIYALMIQENIKIGDFTEAKQLFMDLKSLLATNKVAKLSFYVSKEVIEALAQGLGVDVITLMPIEERPIQEEGENEEIEEVIE